MVTGNAAWLSAASHVCSSLDRSTRYWIVSCSTPTPFSCANVAVSAATSASPAARGGVKVVAPIACASRSGVSAAATAGHESGSSISRCAAVRFDSGRKTFPFESTRCSSRAGRPAVRAPGGVQQRHAVAAIVRDDHAGGGAEHRRQVVLDQLRVPAEAVAPARRLGGEPVAGKVQRADAEPRAERAGHRVPVDAAGRPAMHEQQHRRGRIAELDVEDVDRGRGRVSRAPGEVAATASPLVRPHRGHDRSAPAVSCAVTSAATRSPDRIAPSM